MNEVELFIEMLEDEDADTILRYFQESLVGTRNKKATLEQKKQHIRKVFKSKTPNMIRRRRKGAADPFYNFINNYSFTIEKANSFNEHLVVLKELKGDLSTCTRFANLLLEFPDEMRERLADVEDNLKKDRDPLDLYTEFQSVEEVKSFFRKFRDFAGEDVPQKVIEVIEKYQPEDYVSKLQKCEKVVRGFNLLDYYRQFEELSNEYDLSILHAAYIRTHRQEDEDVLMLFALEAIYSIMKNQKMTSLQKVGNQLLVMKQQLKEEEAKWKEKQKEVNEWKTETKAIEKNLKEVEKEKTSMMNRLIKMERQIEEIQFDSNLRVDQVRREYQQTIQEQENELLLQQMVQSEILSQFQTDKPYETSWAIVCVSDYALVTTLFPELLIIHADNEEQCQLMLQNDQIKKVYINMKGLSTKSFKKWTTYIEKRQKVYQPLEFASFKSFFEWIAYKKTAERQVVYA